MATLFDFFLRRPRPGLPVPPVPGEVIGERLVEEVDEALSTLNVPGELGEMLKKDLKDALAIKGAYRPGYEPGAVASVKFNLIDAVTNPLKTIKETGGSIIENRSRPSIPLAWTDAEDAVWNKFFFDPTIGWVDPTTGNPVVPPSLQQAILRWNEKARLRVTRVIAEERGIFENPGLTLMMAQRLNDYSGPGTFLPAIISDAGWAEQQIRQHLANAEMAERMGDRAGALAFWEAADKAQKKWAEASEPYRDKVHKEFERVSRLGSQDGAPPAAYTLANSQEAKFWRHWKSRRLYFQTLNFLSTYRDKGLWGTAKIYAWNWGVKKIFGLEPKAGASALARLRYYSYPANALTWVQEKTIGRVLKPILNKLTDAKALFARTWKRFIKKPLTKGIEWIRDKVVRKIAGWVAMKLGITGLGAALGSVLPGAGTALGAIISAIASFLVETAIQKMGGVWRVAFVAVVGGVSLVFAILMAGGLGFVVLVSLIFNTNAVFPGAVPPLPPAAQVTVKKESCVKIVGFATWHCQNPRTIKNNTGVHEIKWQITIANGSDQTATITISDEECGQTWNYTLDAGEEKTPNCKKNYNTNDPALHNTPIINNVSGTTTVGSDTFPLSTTGILNIGTPPNTFPSGWPTSGVITQGPNVPCPSHGSAEAIDIANVAGTSIFATHAGKAVEAGRINSSCGYGVRITATVGASTFTSQYCHMARVDVSAGARISDGQQIGLMNSTGNSSGSHLHYSFIGLPMAPPYIPRSVCCCREDLDGDGSWQDEDAQYCGSGSPSTIRCNKSVSR